MVPFLSEDENVSDINNWNAVDKNVNVSCGR